MKYAKYKISFDRTISCYRTCLQRTASGRYDAGAFCNCNCNWAYLVIPAQTIGIKLKLSRFTYRPHNLSEHCSYSFVGSCSLCREKVFFEFAMLLLPSLCPELICHGGEFSRTKINHSHLQQIVMSPLLPHWPTLLSKPLRESSSCRIHQALPKQWCPKTIPQSIY